MKDGISLAEIALCFICLALRELQAKVKRSMRVRCWGPLSTEWMPEDKAKTFSLHEYPVQLELKSSKRRKKGVTLANIEDIFGLDEDPTTVLMRGKSHFLFFYRMPLPRFTPSTYFRSRFQ